MPDVPYQQELKVTLSWKSTEKNTLALSPTGDLQLSEGKEKLATQLMRAIVNDNSKTRELLNMPEVSTRRLGALFTLILRTFRQTQIEDVKKSDADFSGYKLYRKAAGSNTSYVLVSPDPITYRFIDSDDALENGITYNYGVTKVYRNIFETTFIDKFSIFPTKFASKQQVKIGQNSVVLSGDRQVLFYVDYNKRYKGSELLEKIISILPSRDDADPRKYFIDIVVQTLQGTEVSVSSKRLTP